MRLPLKYIPPNIGDEKTPTTLGCTERHSVVWGREAEEDDEYESMQKERKSKGKNTDISSADSPLNRTLLPDDCIDYETLPFNESDAISNIMSEARISPPTNTIATTTTFLPILETKNPQRRWGALNDTQ